MSRSHVLGLFPWIGADSTGGIELSGRLAWKGIYNACKRDSGRVQLFCYRPTGDAKALSLHQGAVTAVSRFDAVRKAVTRRWAADVVLVWHISLLQLLPFMRTKPDRVALFLHGVEAWRNVGLLNRILLRRVHLLLSNTRYTWRRFLAYHPRLAGRRHRTVHLGVGVPTGEVVRPAGEPAALIVSRLARGEDYKGHRELIAAWPLVLERIPDAQLWIAGEGDLRPDLESMVQERGLMEQVRFYGWVTEEEKQELIRAARCLAMPSRGEGFGLVYLEAMRLGRPCLVSTRDAGREVVNPPETGLAADPDDPRALAAALGRLLTPGAEWERWSRRAQARYENNFTARHFQERLISAMLQG